jgi:hypothetical protein
VQKFHVFGEALRRRRLKDTPVTSKTPSPLSKLDAALAADISAVSPIDAVASILEVNLPHDWDGPQ